MAGFTINVSYDASVTALQTTNPTLYAQYTSAVQTAVNYFQSVITTPITVNISFGWGEVGGTPISAGASGQSSTYQYQTNYAQLLTRAKATLNTSAIQVAALATLPATDPTGGAVFSIATAEAAALGFDTTGYPLGGSVGLDSTTNWAWTQTNIPAGASDAIGTLEHEISEVLGRSDSGGKGGQYSLLDMFRYTAQDGLSTDTIGAAAGVRDQPFVTGYNANAPSYFSYNGSTVTLLYETPADVAGGADVGDWAPSVPSDSFGDAGTTGTPDLVSPTDLAEMNVLGYTLGNTGTQTPSLPVFFVQNVIVNTVSTPDGNNLPTAISGDFNLEQVTSPVGTNYATPQGYQGVALVNGRSFNMLHGNYAVQDINSGGGDTIIGGDGNDTINALVGNDLIDGGRGNATVFGTAGDVIDDTSGNTYFAVTGGTNAIVVSLTANVGALLYGGVGDTFVGGLAATTVIGAPNDTYVLGAGNDTVNVIPINETLTFGSGNATVYGGAGDTINASSGGSLITFTGGSNPIVLAGSGNSVLLYSGFGDTLTGGAAPVTMIGAASDDIILGTGADTVNALPIDETITFGTSDATVFGGIGDTIGSAAGTDVILNGGSNAIVVVQQSGAVVVDSAPTDTLTGGGAAAQIIGTANDTITLGSGADTVNALAGNQLIILGNAAGSGTVFGASGDAFTTGMGSDYVDFISGHAGIEVLEPGSGNDTAGHDTIADFNAVHGDRILETGTAMTNTIASAHSSGGSTTITLSDGSTVTLAGVTAINSSFFA